jgi:hypothetical protein
MNSIKIKDYFKNFLNQSYGTTLNTKLEPESYVFFPRPNSILDALSTPKYTVVPAFLNARNALQADQGAAKYAEETEIQKVEIDFLNQNLVDWNERNEED